MIKKEKKIIPKQDKIFAHVLANRLQNNASVSIGRKQIEYNKGRYIGENTRLILDIFEFYRQNDLGGILLFLDFERHLIQ